MLKDRKLLIHPPLRCLTSGSGEPLRISGWNFPRKN